MRPPRAYVEHFPHYASGTASNADNPGGIPSLVVGIEFPRGRRSHDWRHIYYEGWSRRAAAHWLRAVRREVRHLNELERTV